MHRAGAPLGRSGARCVLSRPAGPARRRSCYPVDILCGRSC